MKYLGPALILASLGLCAWGAYHLLTEKKTVAGLVATYNALPTNSDRRVEQPRTLTGSRKLSAKQTVVTSVPAIDTTLDQKVLVLQQELATVKSQLESVQQRLDRHATGLQSLRSANTTASDDPEPEQVERNNQERHALMEDKVRNENVDPDWAADAIDSIELALNDDELLDTTIYDMDCRATVCRVEVSHADPDALNRFQSLFLTQVSDILPDVLVEHTDLGDGAIGTVIYLTRDGYSLL